MRRTVTGFSIFTAAMLAAGAAAADSPQLKGSYGFTGTAACLVAPGHVGDPNGPPLPNPTPGVALANSGFKPNLQPNDSGPGQSTQSYQRSFSVEGVRVFNGDGTGSVRGAGVGIVPRPTPGPGGFPHFPPSASTGNFSYNFTYPGDGNGGFVATMVPGSYSETFVTGPRTGQTATVDAIPPLAGMISQDGKTLIASHLTTTVETRSYSNGDVDPEICHRSRVLINLPNGGGDDDHGNGKH